MTRQTDASADAARHLAAASSLQYADGIERLIWGITGRRPTEPR